jgi:hypothetical protein
MRMRDGLDEWATFVASMTMILLLEDRLAISGELLTYRYTK